MFFPIRLEISRFAVACSLNWFLNDCVILFFLVVLEQRDFLTGSSSSSAWSHSELTQDEDSSGLDYMLALSLQSDGESLPGGVESNLWSGIWDHKIEKTTNTSVNNPLSLPNNNYPNFTIGTSTSAVEDHGQTGKWYKTVDKNNYQHC